MEIYLNLENMLKIDEKIVQEFIGTKDVAEMISPLKHSRMYFKMDGDKINVDNTILILTPMMKENNEALNGFIKSFRNFGVKITPTEHKRGDNFVYTFTME
jgi:hypothetical protein